MLKTLKTILGISENDKHPLSDWDCIGYENRRNIAAVTCSGSGFGTTLAPHYAYYLSKDKRQYKIRHCAQFKSNNHCEISGPTPLTIPSTDPVEWVYKNFSVEKLDQLFG